jgi:hypothetical protein
MGKLAYYEPNAGPAVASGYETLYPAPPQQLQQPPRPRRAQSPAAQSMTPLPADEIVAPPRNPRDNPNGPGVRQPQIARDAAKETAVLQNLPPSSDPQVNALRAGMVAGRQKTLERETAAGPIPLNSGVSAPVTAAPVAAAAGTGARPGLPGSAAPPVFDKNRHAMLQGQYQRAERALNHVTNINYDSPTLDADVKAARDEHLAAKKALDDYEVQFLKPQAPAGQAAGLAAHPYVTAPGTPLPAANAAPGAPSRSAQDVRAHRGRAGPAQLHHAKPRRLAARGSLRPAVPAAHQADVPIGRRGARRAEQGACQYAPAAAGRPGSACRI